MCVNVSGTCVDVSGTCVDVSATCVNVRSAEMSISDVCGRESSSQLHVDGSVHVSQRSQVPVPTKAWRRETFSGNQVVVAVSVMLTRAPSGYRAGVPGGDV